MPEEILEKPSALTSAEWRTVVQHPRIGQVILEQAAALKEAVPIILHHHERYAGHGYPFGLRGNEIPLGARIVAIADAYDAMVHDRPYKRAITHEQAIAELRRHAGTQFDPELVELFCDLYANHAPEPDATITALTAASSLHAHAHAHATSPIIVPEPGASRVNRRRRRTDPRPVPVDPTSSDGARRGRAGRDGRVDDDGARRRVRAGRAATRAADPVARVPATVARRRDRSG